MPKTSGTTQTIRSVEFHAITESELLVLNVQTLELFPCSALALEILNFAQIPKQLNIIKNFFLAASYDPEDIIEAIELLQKNKLLVTLLPQAAPMPESSSAHLTFMVNVSQRCNLTCDYCYVNEGLFDYESKPIAKMRKVLYSDLANQIVELFQNFKTYCIHFYGGEPLLNFKAIKEIVYSLKAKGSEKNFNTEFHITTNGTLLNDEIAEFMSRHEFTVYYSIDGQQESHDEYRTYRDGKGSYADVVRNFNNLRSKPGVHIIGSSVIREGYSLSSALKQLDGRGVNQCKAERVRLNSSDSIALSGCSHNQYLQDIDDLTNHYIESISNFKKPIDFRLSSKILQFLTKTRRDFFCPAGDRMFGISSNGEIYPCALHVGRKQSILGTMEKGLDAVKVKNFREKYSPKEQKDCVKCWNRNLCGGGCSAMVDRFGHEDCKSLMQESEAAMKIYWHFAQEDPLQLLCLVSPDTVRWANGVEMENQDDIKEPVRTSERMADIKQDIPHVDVT